MQIASTVSRQAHDALRPLASQAHDERRIAKQGRAFIDLYGAVLVGALWPCDAALEREIVASWRCNCPRSTRVLDVWDEARDERDGLGSHWKRSERRSGSTEPAARRRVAADDGHRAATSNRLRRAGARRPR